MSKEIEQQCTKVNNGESLKKQETWIEGQVDDIDEANIFLRQHNITPEYIAELLKDEAANNRVSRKVDLRLLPLLCGTYFLQFIDKQAISYSAVFDLFETTGITGAQYSWLGSIFYFAYLIAEWPSAYLAQRFPTARVVSIYCFCWGSVMLITAATNSFGSFAAMRFLLGIFGSVVTPAFMMIVSMWYMGEQQPARAGMFYCFNGMGAAIGGILFYGVGYAQDFVIWKIIYLICGGMTVLWSILLFFRLPDNIMSAKSFSTQEKVLLIARAATNHTGIYNRTIKPRQIWEALTDAQIWLLFLYVLLNEVINGGMANFGKLIIKDVAGGDPLRTTLYGIPQGFAQVFWVFTGPYLASRLSNARTYIMALYLCPTIIGTTLIWQLPRSNLAGCLAGYYLSLRALAMAFNIPRSTLQTRVSGTQPRSEVRPANCKLSSIEEHSLVQWILDLDWCGFPPHIIDVRRIVDALLAARGQDPPPLPVGKKWVSRFIQGQPELQTKWTRKLNSQRASSKDPIAITAWFKLVEETRQTYSVLDQDIYNFNETGFAMGVAATSKVVTSSDRVGRAVVIQPGNREWSSWYRDLPLDWTIGVSDNGWTTDELGLEWVKHFNQHTAARIAGVYRLIILDGHSSHATPEFDQYCADNKIITLYMPPHTSHLLQPLDISCYSPLKRAYGHRVLSSLTVVRTPSPPQTTVDDNVTAQAAAQTETPHTVEQLQQQVRYLQERLRRQPESPTSIAIRQLAKSAQLAMQSAVILAEENKKLREENQRQRQNLDPASATLHQHIVQPLPYIHHLNILHLYIAVPIHVTIIVTIAVYIYLHIRVYVVIQPA
ncbi:uncharacterized protein yc1106_07273 [Curvularia clavata]|uniref:HTH CENPB-type domain-containing protein n=1 Tax=Curvularia clavata TaxID=95742 RepID=A0A9Q8ZEH4_CURCL|nr:uncharacterized protein yc1106_07273 [Curvularia clavata]